MRVLLLYPEDDFRGPWTDQGWDWIVDLGRAPKSCYEEWSVRLGCRVSSIYDFAVEIEDLQIWRELLAMGLGQVVDRFGIDWWDVIGLLLQSEMQDVQLALRLTAQLTECRALAASRSSLLADTVRLRSGVPLRVFQTGFRPRLRNRITRSRFALLNLSFDQIRQVAYDKFDPQYRWRQKLAPRVAHSSDRMVLLPSAYSNVTRTALKYASLLPDQPFLLVLARETGAVKPVPENVRSVQLAAFAGGSRDELELRQLENSWNKMEELLAKRPEFDLPIQLGIVRKGARFLRWGLPIRNAWTRVFETCSVTSCLTADDSNPYTRIPMLLARQREIPAVSCHHGALDFRMAFKAPQFSTYLAQGEMERDYLDRVCHLDTHNILMGAARSPAENSALWTNDAPNIVFFTEPYETDLWRAEAIYREVLPRLCEAARKAGKTVVLKLHPFETSAQRRRLVNATVPKKDQSLITIIAAPISHEILRSTWCAVTVESTAAFECASVGIPAFLCGWLRHAYSGYALQFARFGVGRLLEKPADLSRIGEMIDEARPVPGVTTTLVQEISPDTLAEVLLQPVTSQATGDCSPRAAR